MAKLRVATAQFPVAASIARNLRYMADLICQAKEQKADVAHFPETCLGGYAGCEFKSWDGYDWDELQAADDELRRLARKLRIALFYVATAGQRGGRYDKCFCTTGDLEYYRAGQRFVTFELKGFTCGLLICHDMRYPELYRAYKKRGVQVLFQSFYNARGQGPNIHTEIVRPSLQTHAAENYFYISAPNASGHYQSWPSTFVLPDGRIGASCRQHRAGLVVNEIDARDKFYDASAAFRARAMRGVLYSG